jgi:class 3 adenylate cyclase
VDVPEVRFTSLGEDRIAYQVLGEGPIDLLYLSSLSIECIDTRWEYPPYVSFLRRLASFTRLILFDPRGIGASDPLPLEAMPRWEGWADDARAVLDAVGAEQAAFLGSTDAGPIALLFAATQPARTRALVVANTGARFMRAPDYPWGLGDADAEAIIARGRQGWGIEPWPAYMHPDADPAFVKWAARSSRLSCTARSMVAHMRAVISMDVRAALPTIQAPTLVLHRKGAFYPTVEQGRDVAERIPAARFVEVPGRDALVFTKPNAQILDAIEEFLTGTGPAAATSRTLAAILFTDIVGSTDRAARLGDRRWGNLLETHDAITRTVVEEHGGRLVKSTGDGALSIFDGPGRAIRCTFVLRDALQPLGIDIRAGLHTGEIEQRGDDVVGIGVHVAARVLDYAGPGELIVSAAVPLLVTGSGIEFDDRGEQQLKGVPGSWRVFAVEG